MMRMVRYPCKRLRHNYAVNEDGEVSVQDADASAVNDEDGA